MGIKHIFFIHKGLKKKNTRDKKPYVSKKTKKKLSKLFAEDIELYEFIKKRLHLQAKQVGIRI